MPADGDEGDRGDDDSPQKSEDAGLEDADDAGSDAGDAGDSGTHDAGDAGDSDAGDAGDSGADDDAGDAGSSTCDGKVVISQVYGGGGNSGAPYKSSFVELHNRGSVPVVLNGWSIHYLSGGGGTNAKTDLTGTIAPGGYFLIKQAGGANGVDLPEADVTGTINPSATAGRFALVSSTTSLGATCTNATVVDLVGYGTANCFNGAAAPAPSNTKSVIRKNDGCTDTGNNKADFSALAPSPRNSSTPAVECSCN
ncbi:MAG: lamin tail domain-containing protein [Labilithrix sp.]|nr:lamin tail domain-containing protein [Labilithrix sp.]MBX3221997.1 lamin tail domain-containing protein [Labilithrix sp.]